MQTLTPTPTSATQFLIVRHDRATFGQLSDRWVDGDTAEAAQRRARVLYPESIVGIRRTTDMDPISRRVG